jgi:excisionase family DNA binding protein
MSLAGRTDPVADGLARLLVDAVAADPVAIARLRELVSPPPTADPRPIAFTVASLAEALHVSARVVRGAIARGELVAVKRGGRYIIAAGAVDDWASAAADGRRSANGRRHGPLRAAIALLDEPGGANGHARRL